MFTTQTAPRPSIIPVAGQRITSRLVNGTQTAGIYLTARGTLTKTAGDGTTIYNRGSIWAAFDRVGLFDGEDQWLVDPRALRFYCEVISPSSLSATRLTSPADGVYTLEETIWLPFSSLYALRPRDTAFMEHNPGQVLEVFAQLKASGGAGALVDGTAALAVSSIIVEQVHDQTERELPLFQTLVRTERVNITATSDNLTQYIRTNNFLRAMVIQEDSTIGEVSDILNSFQLVTDNRAIIGPQFQDKVTWQRRAESMFGGSVFSQAGLGYVVIFFQEGGRLNKALPPGDPNLRLVYNVQQSLTTGATASYLNVTLFELVRDAYVDPVTGRRVCAPELPFKV